MSLFTATVVAVVGTAMGLMIWAFRVQHLHRKIRRQRELEQILVRSQLRSQERHQSHLRAMGLRQHPTPTPPPPKYPRAARLDRRAYSRPEKTQPHGAHRHDYSIPATDLLPAAPAIQPFDPGAAEAPGGGYVAQGPSESSFGGGESGGGGASASYDSGSSYDSSPSSDAGSFGGSND